MKKDRVTADSKSECAPLMPRTDSTPSSSNFDTPSTQGHGSRRSHARAMGVLEGAAWLAGLTLVVTSAIWTKQTGALPALVRIDQSAQREAARQIESRNTEASLITSTPTPVETIGSEQPVSDDLIIEQPEIVDEVIIETEPELDPTFRWFDGKLVRPARVIYMTVTGYSPDARSCGIYADGKTATMNSVWTNGMKLVAADPKVLPYWSMVSVPGYASDEIVPVLDCGGAIKGNRLDLLYPTHRIARQWGVRQVPVTVWEYVETESDEQLSSID